MPRNALTATGVVACVIALSACVVHGNPESSSTPSVAPASTSEVATSSATATSTAPAAVVTRGQEALRAAGLPADLKLLSSEQSQWSDSSLGCPQPGVMYAQVITSGYVLRFADRDAIREVHVAGNAAIVCSPQLATSAPKRSTAANRVRDLDAIVESARADLAAKLNLKADDVSLRNFEPTTWPDSRLGCGEPLADTAPGPVRGFKLNFATTRQNYTYHTDLNRAFPCPPIATE